MKKLLLLITCISFILALSFSASGIGALAKDSKPYPMPKAEKQLGEYNSRSAYLVDYDTGTVLYERNAESKYQIASMVKIMTLNIVFDEIQAGNLTFDEKITISDRASGMGGSQMFLDAGLEYSVADLIKGVTVVSANDASVALAEKIAGSVEAFVDLMNERAKEYGMQNTSFVNVTGLPENGQYSTAKDVSKMMKNLLKHPKYYEFSGIFLENYTHPDGRITELTNTNKLIRFYDGCDGGKTGFTNDAMFCLSATAKRGDTRIIATVLGAQTSKERNKEITDLFNYAFHNFNTVKIVEKDKIISSNITIKGAKDSTINLTPKSDIAVLEKRNNKSNYDVKIELFDNLKAPIEKGESVGYISVTNENGDIIAQTEVVTVDKILSRSYLDNLRRILENWSLAV